MISRHIAVLPLILLAACNASDESTATGGLTADEAARLDDAATRLDDRLPSPAKGQADALEADVRPRIETERAAMRRR